MDGIARPRPDMRSEQRVVSAFGIRMAYILIGRWNIWWECPDASFSEVEANCFPGEDGNFVFSGFTPRLFEYSMMGCSPILIEGEYRRILDPWIHYIPVRRDLSDVEDALQATADWTAAKRRVKACYETLIDNPQFR